MSRSEKLRTHGHTIGPAGRRISPTYHTWAGMKARCLNPGHAYYQNYGGRGIKVCDSWLDFANFLNDMGEKPSGCSIDRIDPDGDYQPGNCRWASRDEQSNNKRNSRMIEAFGRKQTLQQWANEIGVSHGALIFRIDKAKWGIEKALSTPGRGYGGRKPAL